MAARVTRSTILVTHLPESAVVDENRLSTADTSANYRASAFHNAVDILIGIYAFEAGRLSCGIVNATVCVGAVAEFVGAAG
jgi:hypothetical protein